MFGRSLKWMGIFLCVVSGPSVGQNLTSLVRLPMVGKNLIFNPDLPQSLKQFRGGDWIESLFVNSEKSLAPDDFQALSTLFQNPILSNPQLSFLAQTLSAERLKLLNPLKTYDSTPAVPLGLKPSQLENVFLSSVLRFSFFEITVLGAEPLLTLLSGVENLLLESLAIDPEAKQLLVRFLEKSRRFAERLDTLAEDRNTHPLIKGSSHRAHAAFLKNQIRKIENLLASMDSSWNPQGDELEELTRIFTNQLQNPRRNLGRKGMVLVLFSGGKEWGITRDLFRNLQKNFSRTENSEVLFLRELERIPWGVTTSMDGNPDFYAPFSERLLKAVKDKPDLQVWLHFLDRNLQKTGQTLFFFVEPQSSYSVDFEALSVFTNIRFVLLMNQKTHSSWIREVREMTLEGSPVYVVEDLSVR